VSFQYLLECSVQIYLPSTRNEGKGASLTHPVRATEWVSALWLRNPSRVLVALRLLAAVAAMKRRENTQNAGEKQYLLEKILALETAGTSPHRAIRKALLAPHAS
jgi:hypothetical protein